MLKMRLSDIKDNALESQQNKTKKKLRILLVNTNGVQTQFGRLIERIKARKRKVASMHLVATDKGSKPNKGTLRTRFDNARSAAAKHAEVWGDIDPAEKIRNFQFRDIRPKAASETDLEHASRLPGFTQQEITQKIYRRVGETVLPEK